MKKYRLIAAAGLFLLGACSRGTGSMELRNETDSVAYVIGLNVGYNLQRMDSTLNVEAVCQAVRDVYARTARMTPDEARAVYLRYVNVSQPEQIRAYEEQFLEDFRKSNRSYAKTDTGLTYEVLEIGDESKTPRSDRDTVAIRFVAKTVDGKVVESSYERGDTAHGRGRSDARVAAERAARRGRRSNECMDTLPPGLRGRRRQEIGRGPERDVVLRDRTRRCPLTSFSRGG